MRWDVSPGQAGACYFLYSVPRSLPSGLPAIINQAAGPGKGAGKYAYVSDRAVPLCVRGRDTPSLQACLPLGSAEGKVQMQMQMQMQLKAQASASLPDMDAWAGLGLASISSRLITY